MKNLLIVCDYFKPGFKAGGPIQSLYNLCVLIHDKAHIHVVTQNHDIDKVEYNLPYNRWVDKDLFKVLYLKRLQYLKFLFKKQNVDVLYLNSFFASSTQLFLFSNHSLLRNQHKEVNIFIAPRGEFDPGALTIKARKKKLFLSFFKIFKIKNLIFHATTEIEVKNIQLIFGDTYEIRTAANIPKIPSHRKDVQKKQNISEFFFLSRISSKKNLKFALKAFSKTNVEGEIQFNIIGPIEDVNYWNECQDIFEVIPNNINCKYLGEIPNEDISKVLKDSHYFFFPTFGENYGHVIYESLALGKPILISDQTPWVTKEFDNGVFASNLESETYFLKVIEKLHGLNQVEYNKLSRNAYQYALLSADINKIKDHYINLFKLDNVKK